MSLKNLSALVCVVVTVALVLATFGDRKASAASTLIVDDNLACAGAIYPTISSAVAAASAGDTIKVCPGTYAELVNVNKTLTILGVSGNVISNKTNYDCRFGGRRRNLHWRSRKFER